MMNAECFDCGLEYESDGWVEAIVPDSVWELIKPKGSSKDGGLLCISCICKRICKLNIRKVPVFICGTEPIAVIPNYDSKFHKFVVRNWKIENGR